MNLCGMTLGKSMGTADTLGSCGTELEHRGELDQVHQVTDHKPPPGADEDDVCGAKSVNCESGRDPEDPVDCSARVASAAGCGGTATNRQAFCLGR